MISRSIFKSYSGVINIVSRIIDPFLVIIAALVAYYLRFNSINIAVNYQLVVVYAVLSVLIIFPLFGLYSSWRGQSLWKQIRAVMLAWIIVIIFLIMFLFGLKLSANYSRIWLFYWAISGLVSISFVRVLIYYGLHLLRKKGRNIRFVVVIGAGDLARKVVSQLIKMRWTGYKILALFDDNKMLKNTNIHGIPVLTNLDSVSDYVNLHTVDEVWVALPLRAEQRMKKLLFDLRHFTGNIKLIPDIFGFSLLNHSMTDIAGIPAVNLSETPMGGFNKVLKELEDRVLGLFIFILIIPILILIAIGIKLTSQGPILFKQKRHGCDGRVINVYKFRTMESQNDYTDVVIQAKKNDDRVTKIGRFLRRTSLDELPQFYNVLQGRMSIVGPRPHAIQHNELYKDQVERYMLRHMVKPGITGWAQVNGLRGETDTLEKMKKRIEYDLYYIENWSLWFDIKIIVMTVFTGFIHKNAY